MRPGDNLYRIALEHGLDYRELASWNGISQPERLQVGTVLRLRPPATPSADAWAEEPPPRWIWPVRGVILAQFDERAGRKGIQIAASHGTPVLAAAAGQVVYAGQALRGYGKLTIVRHGGRMLSVYAHQSSILVQEGERVAQGQKIGEVGDTDAQRMMLHFEIRVQGRPVDPMRYLPG